MEPIQFILNNQFVEYFGDLTMPLLDYIRKKMRLNGTKIGCREGDCGACTVLVGQEVDKKILYKSIVSCLTPMGNMHKKHVVTIESFTHSPVGKSLIDLGATQCGFCTPGIVMSLSVGIMNHDILEQGLDGNICRCTGYNSIKSAAQELQPMSNKHMNLEELIANNVIPEYFSTIQTRLGKIENQTLIPTGKVIAGGTDLMINSDNLLPKNKYKFVCFDNSSNYIHEDELSIYIGANTTFSDFIMSNILRKFIDPKKLLTIASTQIRNTATLAGNIMNASPIGDLSIILLALDAKLHIEKEGEMITSPLHEFYLSYKKTILSENDIIKEIEISKNDFEFHFEKVAKRKHLDIASVNSACMLRRKDGKIIDIRLSAGGVFQYPLFLKKTSAFLCAKEPTKKIIEEALEIINSEIAPISDIRGSMEYKKLLLRHLVLMHISHFFGEKLLEGLIR